MRPLATTGPPRALVPSLADHLMFFCLFFLMLQLAGMPVSTVLARLRCTVAPNIGQERSFVPFSSEGARCAEDRPSIRRNIPAVSQVREPGINRIPNPPWCLSFSGAARLGVSRETPSRDPLLLGADRP